MWWSSPYLLWNQMAYHWSSWLLDHLVETCSPSGHGRGHRQWYTHSGQHVWCLRAWCCTLWWEWKLDNRMNRKQCEKSGDETNYTRKSWKQKQRKIQHLKLCLSHHSSRPKVHIQETHVAINVDTGISASTGRLIWNRSHHLKKSKVCCVLHFMYFMLHGSLFFYIILFCSFWLYVPEGGIFSLFASFVVSCVHWVLITASCCLLRVGVVAVPIMGSCGIATNLPVENCSQNCSLLIKPCSLLSFL